MKSSLGGSGGKGGKGGLGPLRGSAGESIIQTSATGPRLSNEGFMRSSAEAYLRGSTDVSIRSYISDNFILFLFSHFKNITFSIPMCQIYLFHMHLFQAITYLI